VTPAPQRQAALVVAAAACVVAPTLVAAGVGSFATLIAVVLMLTLAPGAAVLPLLAREGRPVELGLVVGVSLAATTLVAQGMLWTGQWRPELVTYLVAGLCLPLIGLHLSGRAPRPPRR
jgi:uncharacterized membrane protein